MRRGGKMRRELRGSMAFDAGVLIELLSRRRAVCSSERPS